jgi:DNA-binding transcriptional MerR regulator
MRELEEATGQPARQIRYLISEGVVPPPNGNTRSATYDERHLAAVRRYVSLKESGFGLLDALRDMISRAEAESRVTVLHPAEGIELRIDAETMARLDVDSAVEGIRAALAAQAAKTSKERA